MSKRKNKPEELNEQERVNRRVDAMLNPKQPDPPLDIFKDAKTAPEVSGTLLGKVDDSIDADTQSTQTKPPAKKPEPASKPTKPMRQETAKDPVSPNDPLSDETTDEAVADIAAKEGNTLLALQDAIGRKASHVAGDLAQQDRQAAKRRRWAWFVFLVLFVVLVLLALPLNPYTCRWPVAVRLSVTTDILPSVCK